VKLKDVFGTAFSAPLTRRAVRPCIRELSVETKPFLLLLISAYKIFIFALLYILSDCLSIILIQKLEAVKGTVLSTHSFSLLKVVIRTVPLTLFS
jgi:hypothetical protein